LVFVVLADIHLLMLEVAVLRVEIAFDDHIGFDREFRGFDRDLLTGLGDGGVTDSEASLLALVVRLRVLVGEPTLVDPALRHIASR
jgi:hypothetical protein